MLIPRRWLALLGLILFSAGCSAPSTPEGAASLRVYAPEVAALESSNLAHAVRLIPGAQRVDDPSAADVVVLQGEIPTPEALGARFRAGSLGVVLFLGPETSPEAVSALLGVPVTLTAADSPQSLIEFPGADDPILQNVLWNSAPQIRERFLVQTPLSSVTPLVAGYEDSGWLLWAVGERGVIFNGLLGEENTPFQEWAYFNYFIYHLVQRAAGKPALRFAHYPASPMPHAAERWALLAAMGVLLALSVGVFAWVRRYSLRHPQALDALVTDRARFDQHQAGTNWEEVGFHRPLGGFLVALIMGLILFIPLIIYQNLILPVYILPSAQALGIWGRVTQFFNLLWLLLDMGTSAAFIKFFSQYRVSDPRRAIQYGQVFVWWQALSGSIQVAVITLTAGALLPDSVYALYTWSVIVHALIQLPGFYAVFRHGLMAWQRFDYAQLIEAGLYLFLPMAVQPLIVSALVAWGRASPVFGPSMGGLIGLGLAAYAIEAIAFGLGFWLYRRLGYNTRLLFLAHFDRSVVREAFRFGVFEMLGSLAWGVGQAVEIIVTQTRLVNYTEVWGNWGLAQNFIFAYNISTTLYNNIMPALSEAVSHTRRALSQYYAAMAYKWGGMLSAFVGAVLLAVADRFILGASGPEFVRAAAYVLPLAIWGAIQYASWVGDTVQRGANRPQLISLMISIEQIIRITLAYLLIERLQITALILAYFVGLLTKNILTYAVNHRYCFPQRFYAWQSLAAPLLAGTAHWALLRWLTGLIWQGDQITSVIIFFLGILPSFPVYAFLYGICGGWDHATLGELKAAVSLSGLVRPLSWVFWASTALGARLSPLHNRFPITVRPAALVEAQSLTQERVNI